MVSSETFDTSKTFADLGLPVSMTEVDMALRAAFDTLVAEGVPGLSYLGGDDLLGDDAEGAVDSSHPTDLGFQRQAALFESALRPLLRGTN